MKGEGRLRISSRQIHFDSWIKREDRDEGSVKGCKQKVLEQGCKQIVLASTSWL